MGEFFHGWKRKLGVLALVAACLLTVGWVRSLTLWDEITLPLGKVGSGLLISAQGGILCTWSTSRLDATAGWKIIPLSDILGPSIVEILEDGKVSNEEEVETGLQFIFYWLAELPFAITQAFLGMSLQRGDDIERQFINYCPLVLVLTFISVWSLLSKSRPCNPKEITKPTPIAGA